jgi:hypothetical protein
MIDYIFYWCVRLLQQMARKTHMTYEEINVLIFCIIEPILFLVMLLVIIYQNIKLRRLYRQKNKT